MKWTRQVFTEEWDAEDGGSESPVWTSGCEGKEMKYVMVKDVCVCACSWRVGLAAAQIDEDSVTMREWTYYRATTAFGWETRRGGEREKESRVEGHGVAE